MNLLSEIKAGLANLNNRGSMLSIQSLPDTAPAWIFREDDSFGVALEIAREITLSERFAGSRLATVRRVVDGQERYLLRLESSVEKLRNEFATVCAQMVDPGENGCARKLVLENPQMWWENWRQLLGNAVINQSAFSVLGELLALETILTLGLHADWRGAELGSVDIDTPDAGYEVKSTLSRYDSHVHITGQFQLADFDSRKLYLVHQRFEPVSSGDSVNDVVRRLVAVGQVSSLLEDLLTRVGLEAGSTARNERFRLIESKIYKVDENFPRLTNESFVTGLLPAGVIRVEYQVDLDGLVAKPFAAGIPKT